MESNAKGRGHDLYALRGYLPNDSARHVHWKASPRFGALLVREFAREDDCRVLLVFDPHNPAPAAAPHSNERQIFDRAVTFSAPLAWNFHDRDAQLEFRTAA